MHYFLFAYKYPSFIPHSCAQILLIAYFFFVCYRKMASAFYNDDKILFEQITQPVSLPSLSFSLDELFDITYTANCIINNNYKKVGNIYLL